MPSTHQNRCHRHTRTSRWKRVPAAGRPAAPTTAASGPTRATDTCCLNSAPPHTKARQTLHRMCYHIHTAGKKGPDCPCSLCEAPQTVTPAPISTAPCCPSARPRLPHRASPCSGNQPRIPSHFPQAPISEYWAVPQATTLPAQLPRKPRASISPHFTISYPRN